MTTVRRHLLDFIDSRIRTVLTVSSSDLYRVIGSFGIVIYIYIFKSICHTQIKLGTVFHKVVYDRRSYSQSVFTFANISTE